MLGRRSAGTLEIDEDNAGLRFAVTVNPADPAAQSVAAMIERGDVASSSFGFTTAADEWGETPDGYPLRTLTEIARLYDVGPVTYPAYPDTEAGLRTAFRSLAETRGLLLDELVRASRENRLAKFVTHPAPEALVIARKRFEALTR